MKSGKKLLIAVDAGHGGWDNGARSATGRLEKNDNLTLALAVQKELLGQGIDVLMTRDTDVFVTLEDRAEMANEAKADLFISLHRNSYIEETAYTKGVENFIYLTAPWETSGRAAQLVLDAVVNVGVQADIGVKRGDYYVLRKTAMPAMLLEMGYIINEEDNRLFDENLEAYAAAIAKGAMEYFGLTYRPKPQPPENTVPDVATILDMVNRRLGLSIPLEDAFNTAARKGMTMAVQTVLNMDFNAGLTVDGILGPKTLAAFPTVKEGNQGNVVFVVQALLALNGYYPGSLDGKFGPNTRSTVMMFQRDCYLQADGIVGQNTLYALLNS